MKTLEKTNQYEWYETNRDFDAKYWGTLGKDMLLVICEKFADKEDCELDLLCMKVGQLHNLPFGVWVKDNPIVVPMLKAINKKLKQDMAQLESEIHCLYQTVQTHIGLRSYDPFSFIGLKYSMFKNHILPDLQQTMQRFAWLLRVAQGKQQVEEMDLEEVKAIPLLSILGRSIHETGGRAFYLCPLHKETTPSFCWYKTNNSWYCFGCGVGGDNIALVMKMQGCSFKEAISILKTC